MCGEDVFRVRRGSLEGVGRLSRVYGGTVFSVARLSGGCWKTI